MIENPTSPAVYVTDPSEPIQRILRLVVGASYPLADSPDDAAVWIVGEGMQTPQPRITISRAGAEPSTVIRKPFDVDELLAALRWIARAANLPEPEAEIPAPEGKLPAEGVTR